MEPEQTWAGVEKIIEHFGYDGGVLNDIAVLRLAQEVKKHLLEILSPYRLLLNRLISPFSLQSAFPLSQSPRARNSPARMPQQLGGELSSTRVSQLGLTLKFVKRDAEGLVRLRPTYFIFRFLFASPECSPSFVSAGDFPETLQELQDLLPIVTKADCVDNQWELSPDKALLKFLQIHPQRRPSTGYVLCRRSRPRN